MNHLKPCHLHHDLINTSLDIFKFLSGSNILGCYDSIKSWWPFLICIVLSKLSPTWQHQNHQLLLWEVPESETRAIKWWLVGTPDLQASGEAVLDVVLTLRSPLCLSFKHAMTMFDNQTKSNTWKVQRVHLKNIGSAGSPGMSPPCPYWLGTDSMCFTHCAQAK